MQTLAPFCLLVRVRRGNQLSGVCLSVCPSATLKLTVRLGGDRRWTLQQIAGLPEVLNLIKQMPGGIMAEHPGGEVTEQGRGVWKSDNTKIQVRIGLWEATVIISEM